MRVRTSSSAAGSARPGQRVFGSALLLPSAAVFVLFVFYPPARGGWVSMQGSNIFGQPTGYVGLQNFGTLFSGSDFAQTMWHTAVFCPFHTVVAPFPHTASSPDAGTAIGGASLWIDGPGHSSAQQQAAYEFADFLESAPSQAVWAKVTGDLVGNDAAKQLAAGKAALADPNVAVMYKQLADDPASAASAGCRLGAYPAVRADLINGFNQALSGTPVATAMTAADQQADQAIAQYNTAVKK